MALHGPIQVNGETIGQWQARRTTPGLDADGSTYYECAVTMYADDPPRVHSFQVRHRYDDGALALAAKVFALAANLPILVPVPPDDGVHW